MRDDFCAFILTHGRPDRVYTYETLRRAGYTGKIYVVIDDEDKSEAEYRKRYGEEVLQFSKEEIAKTFDEGDNFGDRRVIVYARNACWDLARQVGVRYFIQLDDDYKEFRLPFNIRSEYVPRIKITRSLDEIIRLLLNFYIESNAVTVAMAQGGDFIGNWALKNSCRRKAMNSFICSIDRPFKFFGRVNEDVNTYTTLGRLGVLFLTVLAVRLEQPQTQSAKGGMTEMYLDSGTYIKSFYSVMYAPSCVKVGPMGNDAAENPHYRLHHHINWNRVAPKILREEWRKAR